MEGEPETDGHRFPYAEDDVETYTKTVSALYKFYLQDRTLIRPSGYMLDWVVNCMPWDKDWNVDHTNKIISPRIDYTGDNSVEAQNSLIESLLKKARSEKTFMVLEKWRNELYPVHGMSGKVTMERAGSALFGINSYGVHMTAYVRAGDQIKIWVPRRASNKHTYGGMLDNTVAGGISMGETAMESLVREAEEEASFPEDLIKRCAKSCGTVSYFFIRDEKAGGEVGLMQPECQFVYDLEVTKDVIPKPNDDEVEDFQLWSVERVQEAMAEGQFKPNCAMVLLDFFIRHGILTPNNEENYVEIVSRLHRKLPFPTR